PDAGLLVRALGQRESRRGPEPDDARHVERPGAKPALVPAAVEDRREPHARVRGAYVEAADALRAVELVGGEGHQVDAERVHVERLLPERLRRAGVEKNPLRLAEPPAPGRGAQRPDLVVRGP